MCQNFTTKLNVNIRLLVSDCTIRQNVVNGFYQQAGIIPQWV
jgi:hypothetical protein